MKTKETCLLCQIVSNSVPSYRIYEDEKTIAVLDVNGAVAGHTFIIPKNHYPIIEQVPNEELGHHFSVANKVSTAIFESLKIQGTNLFVANGIPAGQKIAHFMINVVPRKQNDNINLQWKTKQLNEEEISTVELKLKEQIKDIGIVKAEKTQKPKEFLEKKQISITNDEDDYFMSQMRRIP